MRRAGRLVLAAALMVYAGLLALWVAAPLGFPAEAARHVTPHLAVLGVLIAAAGAALSGWRTALAPAVPALLLSWSWLVTGFAPERPDAPGAPIRVAAFNAHGSPDALAQAADWAVREGVDVIALSEAHTVEPDALRALYPSFPHLLYDTETVTFPGRSYTTRVVLLSRRPLDAIGDGAEETDPDYERPALFARATFADGETLVIAVAHPFPPRTAGAVARRSAMFEDLAGTLEGEPGFILLGDLNASVWSPGFGRLPGRRAGDPRFISTFPGWMARGGIVLDHILIGDALDVRHAAVGPDLGSDHRPVLAELVRR